MDDKQLAFLSGNGEMSRLIRYFDWSKTPLGSPDTWSQGLRTTVSIVLSNRFPMLLWWGPDYIGIYNDAYIPILGTKHPRALGQPVRECWSEIWHILQPLIDSPFKGGPSTWMEDIPLEVNRNGFLEETHFTIAYSPVPDETAPGRIGGVLATVTEITAKVVGERRINLLRELGAHSTDAKTKEDACRLAAKIIGGFPDDIPFAAFYLIKEDGKCAILTSITDIGPGEIMSQQMIDLENQAEHPLPFAQALKAGRMQMVDNQAPGRLALIPIPSNRINHLEGFIVAGINPRISFSGSYESFFELLTTQVATALANAVAFEEERKRAEALEQIDRAKTVFFSNISHEFRTPLTLILSPLEELLNRHENLDTETRQHLETTHRNALRLLRLVNALLDFSRIESGRHQPVFTPVDLPTFTRNLASNFRPVIEKAGLELVIKAQPLLQPIYVDAQMWEKIVFNLLSNALKYTLQGSITVSLSAADKFIVLKVTDTGVGIPENELPNMFQRFHRVQQATGRTYEGTGIGLSMIKELVLIHKGTIEVESTLHKGSTFTVKIPLGKDHIGPGELAADNAAPVQTGNIFMEKMEPSVEDDLDEGRLYAQQMADAPLVLIVDDNADMRTHLYSMLSKDCRVITAIHGRDALNKLAEHLPDLVLSDIMMPVMDGIELLKEIKSKSITAGIPVILLTARAGEESRIEGWQTGADDYLVKPFSSRELITRVQTNIRNSRIRKEAMQSLERVFRFAPVEIAILRGDPLRYEQVNDAALKGWGKSFEQVINKPWFEVFPELKGLGFENKLQQVLNSGTPYMVNEAPVWIRHTGQKKLHYYNYVAQAVKNEDDKSTGIMITGMDVTEIVMARKKIEESEKKFRKVLLQSPNIFMILKGEDMVIDFVNEPLLKSWDKDWNIIGKPLLQVLPEIKDQPFPKLLKQVYQTGVTHYGNEEKAVLIIDGKPHEIYYNYAYQPLNDADGAVAGITVMATDVTEQVLFRKKIEESESRYRELSVTLEEKVNARTEELSEKNIQLEKMNQELGSFSYVASHDLQEPLRKISTFSERILIDKENVLSDKSKDFFNRMIAASGRMQNLIDALLDYSRMNTGQGGWEETDLNKIVREVEYNLQVAIESKKAVIHASPLPVTWVIPYQVLQLFSNLISNSLKYCKAGVAPVIKIRSAIPTAAEMKKFPGKENIPFLKISFEDNGIGFEQQYEPKLFELFQRLHGKTEYEGTGIGLAICKKIAENHGGFLTATGQPGIGATFDVFIPIMHSGPS